MPSNQELISPEQLETLFPVPEQIEPRERFTIINDVAGFFPLTTLELNEAINVLSFQGESGQTARHLNEVLWHQKNRSDMEDPADTVRSKVAEYEGFALQAQQDGWELSGLGLKVQQMLNPTWPVADYLREELVYEEGTNPDEVDGALLTIGGVRQIVRYIEGRCYLSGGFSTRTFDMFEDADRVRGPGHTRRVVDPYSKKPLDDVVREHILSEFGTYLVRDMRERIMQSIENAHSRQDFWQKVLVQSRSHLLARRIADRALEALATNEQAALLRYDK